MKFFATLSTFALAASSAVAQLMINTPTNVVVCQPLLISWTGGTSPFFLSILPGSQPSAPALLDFGQVTGDSLTWTVNITAGTSIGLTLRDSTGAVSNSAPFTINGGTDTSCLNNSGNSGSSTSGSTAGNTSSATSGAASSNTPTSPATSAPSTPTSTPTSPLTSAATSNTSRSTSSPVSSASSASASSSANAAPTQAANVGAAALLGAAAVALLA